MENKINFRYITLEELSNGLQISLNAAGIELVKELKEDGKYEFDIWYELFEDVHGNSEYIFHNDMGESGFGLTNAEGITDGYFISDNGDGYDTNYPESAKVYWFPNYMVINSLDKMFEEGKVFFNKAEDNIVELLGFTIPTWAASALINSDESGLNDEDIEKLNKFVNKIVDKYGNANFMIGSDEEMESQFASRNDIDGFLGGDVVRMYLRPTKEYAKGGGVNTGRSWHLDRQKRNKSESWEKPMSKRKQRYDVGGGVEEISVGNAQDLMKFWSNPENESKKVFFVEEMDNEDGTDTYYVVGNQTKRDYEDSQYWDYDYNFNNIDDAIKQAKMDAEKNNAVYMDNRRVTKKYSKGGGVNSGRSWHLDRQKRNKSESWEKPMSKRKQRYDVGGGVGDKYKYIKLYNERSDKAIKDSIKETGEAPEDSWDWIEQEGGFTAEEIAGYYLESYKDKALSTWLENVKDSIGHDTDEKVTKILKEVSGVSYGKGGGINSGRDLLFKSQEPHEQAYKRKREFKKYGDKGNWFSDFFKDGGSVFVSPHVIAMHDYILKSYGFLLPNEGESGYDKFTYSDFAEELKSNYDIKNPRNKQVYDYLIHLGNVSMFSGNVSDMKKVEERMSTADVKYANGGGVGESKTYKINNTTAIEDEVNKYLHSLKLKDGYSNNMGTFTAKLTEQQLNQLISLIIKVDKNDNVYIVDSVNKVVYDSEDTSAGTAWRTGKYANGGGIDKRDSWHSDRRRFNKSESWEKPMSKRKQRYANGGGVGENILIKDWYIENYPTDDLGQELNDDCTFKDVWTAIHNGSDVYTILGVGDSLVRERVFEKLSEINGVEYNYVYTQWLENDKFGNGGNVGRDLIFKSKQPHEQNYDRKREWKEYKKEGWFSNWFENGGSVAEDGGGVSLITVGKSQENLVTGIYTLKSLFDEAKNKKIKFSIELDGKFFTPFDADENRIHVLVNSYDGSEERISYINWESISDRKFPDENGLQFFYNDYNNMFYFKLTDKQRAEHPYNNWMHQKADMEDKMRDMEDAMMAKGGGINSGRDLLFKSQEPHEQAYKRKREFKKYGDNGSWFNDFFKEGGKTKNSITAYLGEVISTNTAEMALGRKINSWKDEVITIDGISYRKVYLKPEYKQI